MSTGSAALPERPEVIEPDFAAIPPELQALPNFVLWRNDLRDGKWSKTPYNALTGNGAKANDPRTWVKFAAAVQVYQSGEGQYDGIGFEFAAADGLAGIDLDDCRDPQTGTLMSWAVAIVRRFNSYTEVSPSGTGVKIWIRGTKPGKQCRRAYESGEIEIYDRDRYFAMTGCHIDGTPPTVEERAAELTTFYHELFPQIAVAKTPSTNGNGSIANLSDEDVIRIASDAGNAGDPNSSGAKFSALFDRGDTSAHGGDDSRADAALCFYLASYTRKNPEQMDRLFRRSGLMRDKWVSKRADSTWGANEIAKAIAACTWVYDPDEWRARQRQNESAAPGSASSAPTANDKADGWSDPVPFGQFDLPAFPIESLPPEMRDYVSSVAEFYQVGADLPAMLALSFFSMAYAKRIEVEIRDGHIEPVNIWTATVLESGERKSSVFRELEYPVLKHEEAQAESLKSAIERYQCEKNVLEKAIAHAETSASKETDYAKRSDVMSRAGKLRDDLQRLVEVRVERHVADDVTTERVTGLMQENSARVAIMSPEGGPLEMIKGRYTKNNTVNLDPYLKSFSGDTIRVDRMNRPSQFIVRPALTMGLAVQPDVLRGLMNTPALRGRGLLARYFYSLPRPMVGYRKVNSKPIPVEERGIYNRLLEDALGVKPITDQDGKAVPIRLTLDDSARELVEKFANEIELDMRPDGSLASIKDWAAKIVGGVGRLAGILHGIGRVGFDRPQDRLIDGEAMRAAIQIGRYLCAHARAAFYEMGADQDVELARKMLRRIVADPSMERFTRRDMFRAMQADAGKAEALDRPLMILIEHDCIREIESTKQSGAGRKKSTAYEVNPGLRAHSVNCVNSVTNQRKGISESK